MTGIFGTIVSFDGGCYQEKWIPGNLFLLKVSFIDPRAKSMNISIPNPNGIDYHYSSIRIGSISIFAKHQISYVCIGNLSLRVLLQLSSSTTTSWTTSRFRPRATMRARPVTSGSGLGGIGCARKPSARVDPGRTVPISAELANGRSSPGRHEGPGG